LRTWLSDAGCDAGHTRRAGCDDPQEIVEYLADRQRRKNKVTLSTCRPTPMLTGATQRSVCYCQTTGASAAHALRIVQLTVPCVGRSYELFPDGFNPHHLLEPHE